MSVRSWPTALDREPTEDNPARSEPGQGCLEGTRRDVQLDKEEMEKEKINALFKNRIYTLNEHPHRNERYRRQFMLVKQWIISRQRKSIMMNVGENLSASTNNTWSYS